MENRNTSGNKVREPLFIHKVLFSNSITGGKQFVIKNQVCNLNVLNDSQVWIKVTNILLDYTMHQQMNIDTDSSLQPIEKVKYCMHVLTSL